MNIGIYGDSFAESRWRHRIWWQVLASMGHEVESYGEGGGSIIFSALTLNWHAHKHDLNIWVVSSPARISFRNHDRTRFIHSRSINDPNGDFTDIDKQKIAAAKAWFTYLMEMDQEMLVAESVINQMVAKHPRLMIIPAFRDVVPNTEFNLRDLSDWELSHYLDQSGIDNFYNKYIERRPAHLTDKNNRILAELINQNLQPGIFQAQYSEFAVPDVPFDQIAGPK